MKLVRTAVLLTCAFTFGCTTPSGSSSDDAEPVETGTVETPQPVEQPEPEPQPEPPPAQQTPEEPEKKAFSRYTGKTLVATTVEREGIRCEGNDPAASLQQNRRACVRQLADQVTEPGTVVVVMVETVSAGCPTCVAMTAEISKTADGVGTKEVLFADHDAGEVHCTAGKPDQTQEAAREDCYSTLRRQGSSIGADLVLPMAVDEGEQCKSCIAIGATGFTLKVLAD